MLFSFFAVSITYDAECLSFYFQGYSRSEMWYAYLDFGTNYCKLHNLIIGLLFLLKLLNNMN